VVILEYIVIQVTKIGFWTNRVKLLHLRNRIISSTLMAIYILCGVLPSCKWTAEEFALPFEFVILEFS
jgi:hypothetical protein